MIGTKKALPQEVATSPRLFQAQRCAIVWHKLERDPHFYNFSQNDHLIWILSSSSEHPHYLPLRNSKSHPLYRNGRDNQSQIQKQCQIKAPIISPWWAPTSWIPSRSSPSIQATFCLGETTLNRWFLLHNYLWLYWQIWIWLPPVISNLFRKWCHNCERRRLTIWGK